jgi:hypothetical protein
MIENKKGQKDPNEAIDQKRDQKKRTKKEDWEIKKEIICKDPKRNWTPNPGF